MVLFQVWQNSATIKLGLDLFQSEGFCYCFDLLMSCGMLKLDSFQFNLIAWMSQEIHPFLLDFQLTGVQICKVFPWNVLNYLVSVVLAPCSFLYIFMWNPSLGQLGQGSIDCVYHLKEPTLSIIDSLHYFYCFYFIDFFHCFLPSTGIELIKSVFPNYLIASLSHVFVLGLIF